MEKFIDRRVNKAFENIGEKTKEALNNFKNAFSNSDYEIECLVAELELNIPQVGKGSLKITIKKKEESKD